MYPFLRERNTSIVGYVSWGFPPWAQAFGSKACLGFGTEIPEFGRRVEHQVLPKSLPKSQPELIARHCQLLEALLDLIVRLLVTLAIVPNRLILALLKHQERANAFWCFRINLELSYE
ncbi:hypothetical protein Acr_21g0001500 [Actinidia rufa]|uniref:Uncharacterized protein n=1 Tax=Actinidia rufa TaxID=165716 RepID=A0A7J0GFM3_9ERIC|nr:hypothetical protein Acr_21g0001500 [Actinidia rufa]